MRLIALGGLAIMVSIAPGAQGSGDEAAVGRTTIEFEGNRWECHSADRVAVQEYRGKTVLRVDGGHDTAVYLPDVEFQDGTIEVDMATTGRSVPGIGFRGRDDGDWRNQIIFIHQRASVQNDSDFVEQAVVTRRTNTVLVLHIRKSVQDGVRNSANWGGWFHVKVIIKGGHVVVFLNGSEEPSFEVGAMFDANEKGVLGLCGGNFCFTNFQYTVAE